jgi:release factor glutamine methyltransferase
MSEVEFAGIELLTRPGAVMVPRPASLALVECALAHIGSEPAVVADVGTGSGAIAIAIARAAPEAVVWATDDSEEAVALACRNAFHCGVADRVHVRQGDLLGPVPGAIDVVVANLPYLPWAERALHRDLAGEPEHAVFAAGDGLGGYRRLLASARLRLQPEALVAVQFRGHVLAARAGELDGLELELLERAA